MRFDQLGHCPTVTVSASCCPCVPLKTMKPPPVGTYAQRVPFCDRRIAPSCVTLQNCWPLQLAPHASKSESAGNGLIGSADVNRKPSPVFVIAHGVPSSAMIGMLHRHP